MSTGYDGDNATLGHLANIRMTNVHFINNTANIGGAVWCVRAQVVWRFDFPHEIND